jgi:hypothetical protein
MMTRLESRRARFEILEPRCLFAGLVHETDLSYLGAFRLPTGTFGESNFEFVGVGPTYNQINNSLFMVGHDWWPTAIAEVNIPALATGPASSLPVATVRQNFVELKPRIPNMTLDGNVKVGGLMIVDGELYGTMYEYYDGDGTAVDSHFKLSSMDLATAEVSGLFQVGTMGGGWVGGWMTPVPAEWQSALGTEYVTGNGALSIISRTSRGPSAFGFDPAQLGATPAPVVSLLYYDGLNPLRNFDQQSDIFNATAEIKGIAFPDGTDSVLFFGRQGTGQLGYGTGTSDPSLDGQEVPGEPGNHYIYDPADSSKGYHAYPYRYQVWAYNANDLAQVKAGAMQPWDVQPYDVWELSLPYEGGGVRLGGAAYDAASGRLYVSQKHVIGGMPVIHAFQLSADAPAATAWGTIDFATQNNLTITGTETWYEFTAARTGKATVDLSFLHSAGDVNLQILSASLVPLGSSNGTTNTERVDFNATAGSTYYIKISGANADVDARVTNLVTVSGTTVNVFGTAGSDTFAFAHGSSHQITVNGVAYAFSPATLGQLTISGGGGADSLQVTLGSLNDTLTLRSGEITASNSDYQISGTSLETITAAAGTGFDIASLHDAVGNDTLTASPASARLNGTGFDNVASGFDEVRAYATPGGFDVSNLTDSSGNDYFDVGPTSAVLRGPGFYLYGQGFDQYKAFATAGGTDRANLYDGGGNDYFDAGPAAGLMRGSNFYSYAEKFESLNAYATTGGIDTAKLYDSAGNDYFDAGPTSALLRGSSFYTCAERFDKVFAYSQWGGYDIAKLYDGGGNDYFDAGPTSGLMQGSGWYNWADRFDEVIAFATAGGNDIANLYGSIGNDLFTTTNNVGRLTGTNYSLRTEQFEQVNARLHQGGTDLAEFRNFLTANQLFGRTNYSRGTVSGKQTTVFDIDEVKAYAAAGQTPTADVSEIDYLFEKIGSWL